MNFMKKLYFFGGIILIFIVFQYLYKYERSISGFGNFLSSFLDSNFLLAIIGLSVFLLYKLQVEEEKRSAATTIFFEIKNAEKSLITIKNGLSQSPATLIEYIYLMQIDSWSKYKQMFIEDLDRDEWDAVNDFYLKCELIDNANKYNSSFFQKNEEQIRVSKYSVLAEHAKKLCKKKEEEEVSTVVSEEDISTIANTMENFDKVVTNGRFIYDPVKPVHDAKRFIENMETRLSFGSVGMKLKKIAHLR